MRECGNCQRLGNLRWQMLRFGKPTLKSLTEVLLGLRIQRKWTLNVWRYVPK